MYKIFVFNGGVYRFEELVEFVEDSGGLILRRDDFHVSRGVYFIAQEVHVIIIAPGELTEDLLTIAKDLKGEIEVLEVEYHDKVNMVSLIPIYNILSKINGWADVSTVEDLLECPCVDGVCQEFQKSSCIEDVEKTLEALSNMEIAEHREIDGIAEYKLKAND